MNPVIETAAPIVAPFLARHQHAVLSARFRKALGRRRQNPPRSFYDKIFWVSEYADTSLWTACADKVGVRSYVADRCGEGILPELYATYDDADDIDFDALPERFAIKTNNGCASNYLVRSKSGADLDAVRAGLARWLRFPYGELTGQLHYARIEPRVLAEELLSQRDEPDATLVDYKFYCFGGEPRYCYVVSNRTFDTKHTHTRMMYDTSWKPLERAFTPGKALDYTDAPSSLAAMMDVAGKLSEGIPFVRIDLYDVNGEVKFSEMTFMPGMDPGFTEEFQNELGGGIVLPEPLSKHDSPSSRNAPIGNTRRAAGGVGDGDA